MNTIPRTPVILTVGYSLLIYWCKVSRLFCNILVKTRTQQMCSKNRLPDTDVNTIVTDPCSHTLSYEQGTLLEDETHQENKRIERNVITKQNKQIEAETDVSSMLFNNITKLLPPFPFVTLNPSLKQSSNFNSFLYRGSLSQH